MKIDILTLFPGVFENYLSASILKRAQDKKLLKIKIHNLRKWATDKRKTVDDKPYGGGAGMILKIEPIYKALKELTFKNKNKTTFVILTDSKRKMLNKKINYSSVWYVFDAKFQFFDDHRIIKLLELLNL